MQRDYQTGSALLTTLIITGAVGIILAGVSSFTIAEIRSNTALEDTAIAFSAAEAGIEEGLLRWRFDRNIEVPVLSGGASMQESVTKAVRTDITNASLSQSQVEIGKNLTQPRTDSVYDLRIWYKAPGVGDSTQLNAATYPIKLFQDHTLEIDVSDLGGQTLLFGYQIPTGNGFVAKIETKIVQVNADGSTNDVCTTNSSNCHQITDNATSRQVVIGPIPAGGGTSGTAFRVRIKPLIFLASDGTTPAPDTSFINYALTPASGSLVDSGTSFIESTGYFGNAKRKLVAKVDRATGTILGIFDFTIFSNQNIGQ